MHGYRGGKVQTVVVGRAGASWGEPGDWQTGRLEDLDGRKRVVAGVFNLVST